MAVPPVSQAIEAVKLDAVGEKLVELSNGCMCCSLKEDLFRQMHAIVKEQRCASRSVGMSLCITA